MYNILNNQILWIESRRIEAQRFLFYIPIFAVILFIVLKIYWNDLYTNIIQEDHFIENMEFFTYFIAGLVSLGTSLRTLKKGLSLYSFILFILGALLLFISMEEISWGQRVFNFKVPEWFIEKNAQKEMNIHNLELLQDKLSLPFILVSFIFSFAWIPVKYLPYFVNMRGKIKSLIRLFIPGWYLMLYGFPTTLIYSYLMVKFYFEPHFHWFAEKSVFVDNSIRLRDQEPAEFLLAAGFLLYIITIIFRLRHMDNDNPGYA